MMSWFNIEEATVRLRGVNADVLIWGKDLNRSICMDIVAVEIFDEKEWIRWGADTDLLVTNLLERTEDGEEIKKLVEAETVN